MKPETARYAVVGAGAVTVAAGLYNLVSMPETGSGGVFGVVREAQQTYEWVASASAVNSVTFVVVGIAIAIIAFRADFGE